MPLRISLKPRERVILGGAVLRNGDTRTEFLVENEIPILRETDILSPRNVRTAGERVYLALQLMYVDPENGAHHRSALLSLANDIMQASVSLRPIVEEIVSLARDGLLYQALKRGRELREREKELMEHVR